MGKYLKRKFTPVPKNIKERWKLKSQVNRNDKRP